ncbi:MAG: carboxypeptidase M32 [Chlamydiales bacterium]|nr:carboxypeptidase M32 [Chlamydiia bacterium]MCP5508446.1 carboxypeptidase M32 [Chlamydiales bacterium]
MSDAQKHYCKLHKISKKRAILCGISSLLSWDQETKMPSGASGIRGIQMKTMAGLIHKEKTSKKFANALAKLIDLETGEIIAKGLAPEQNSALKIWLRDYKLATALPPHFVEKLAKETASSVHVWRHARKNDTFETFVPYLNTMIDLAKKQADYIGYSDHPYDALLEIYEPGIKTHEINTLFKNLKPTLQTLLTTISSSRQVDNSFLNNTFPESRQLHFSHLLLKDLGYTDQHGRLDLSTHPFSSSCHPTDSRITTRIDTKNLMFNISSVLHECGHSLYAMGLPEEHYGSPLGEAISHGLHESQSRWWETYIGLSKPYWKHYFPLLKKEFKGKFDSLTFSRFYRGINKVIPSMIRVEADEVTYPLHIILRFELEKELIAGTLHVKEIPDAWNSKMEELLGITPPNNKQGCLQDIHWASGGFGYFPTYSLGNMYAAQLFEQFIKDHHDWEERVQHGDLSFVREWLNMAVYRHGRHYDGKALMKKITGKIFSSEPYQRYLTKKYTEIYS